MSRRQSALLTVALIIIVNSFAVSSAGAHAADYVDWTWDGGTTSLCIQRFNSATAYASDIASSWTSWNGIDANVCFSYLKWSFSD